MCIKSLKNIQTFQRKDGQMISSLSFRDRMDSNPTITPPVHCVSLGKITQPHFTYGQGHANPYCIGLTWELKCVLCDKHLLQ